MHECKYPVTVTDCMAATVHFLKSLSAFGVDPTHVIICGDRLGGGIAVVMCQHLLKNPYLPKIRAQMVIYPCLHFLDFQSPANQKYRFLLGFRNFTMYCLVAYLTIDHCWEREMIKGANLPPEIREKYKKWLGHENIPERFKQRGYSQKSVSPLNDLAYQETCLVLDPSMCPLVVEDEVMSQMPEAFIVCCEYDYFRDHSLLYKKRLEDLGIPVTWMYLEKDFHGALTMINMKYFYFPCSQKLMNAMVDFIKKL